MNRRGWRSSGHRNGRALRRRHLPAHRRRPPCLLLLLLKLLLPRQLHLHRLLLLGKLIQDILPVGKTRLALGQLLPHLRLPLRRHPSALQTRLTLLHRHLRRIQLVPNCIQLRADFRSPLVSILRRDMRRRDPLLRRDSNGRNILRLRLHGRPRLLLRNHRRRHRLPSRELPALCLHLELPLVLRLEVLRDLADFGLCLVSFWRVRAFLLDGFAEGVDSGDVALLLLVGDGQ